MGVRLTCFIINHQGMEREPYYVIKEIDSKLYMQISCNDLYDEGIFEDINVFDENDGPFKVIDYSFIQELEKVIYETGAINWDGYNESVSISGILDVGDSYTLYMEFSDGTTVNVYGYNTYPDGFDILRGKVFEIFRKLNVY